MQAALLDRQSRMPQPLVGFASAPARGGSLRIHARAGTLQRQVRSHGVVPKRLASQVRVNRTRRQLARSTASISKRVPCAKSPAMNTPEAVLDNVRGRS